MFGDRKIENSFDALFDLNRDGVLDPLEQGYQLDVISGEFDNEGTEDEDEFDLDDLDLMDEDERREALEDAGYDPDDFDGDIF